MFLCFHYELHRTVDERLWGLFLNLKAQNTDLLAECIFKQITVVLNSDDKFIAQMYDGAPIFSGEKVDVHAVI